MQYVWGLGWLNDRVIDAVNMLVGRQIGEELQSTLMAQATSGFDTQTADTVNDDLTHEAALDHRVSDDSITYNVMYVDSLRPHQPISLYVISQLMNLFPHHIGDDGKLCNGHRTKYTDMMMMTGSFHDGRHHCDVGGREWTGRLRQT